MRYQTYGFSISFLVHAAGIFLLITFCQFVPVESKTLLIDFSTFSVPKPAAMPAKAELPARPKSTPPPPPEKKIVKEKPPVPIAKIKPAKRKTKVIQPEPEVPAVVLPPEPEPQVAEKAVEPTPPDPAPTRLANSEENMSAQVASGPIASDAAPSDAVVQSAPMGKKEYIKAHFLYIKEDIQKNITYPRLARKMGWEGNVVVSFVICEDGTVINIKIVKSSGFALLDKNAVESIKKAVPFPSPPVRAELVVPVSYRLS
jgi:protein TonB